MQNAVMTNTRKKSFIQLLSAVFVIALVNYISAFVFERFDLTSEKRYSLSDASIKLARGLDDVVYIRVYLSGDLPAGFKRLKDETKEMLDEFRAFSKGNIEYQFIDPSESPDKKTREQFYESLAKQGLQYTNLEYMEGDKKMEKIIFPGAVFSHKLKEMPLQLLKSRIGASSEEMLNNSIQQLEYEISATIRKLSAASKAKIAFIEGHGELDELEVADISKSLSEYYITSRIKIDGKLSSLNGIDAIIIAKPDSSFAEKDKFIIDQFVMHGGRVLWLIDAVDVSMDSLQANNTTMGLPLLVNLEDMLFKYGARVNSNLVMDLRAMPIPIVTGYIGNQPKQELFPWYYFPLIIPDANHAIVNNLEGIKTEFVSSVDTVGGKGIKKTILLTSSNYTKLSSAPNRVSLNILREPPDEKQYALKQIPVAVLLEGNFESVFKNRVPPQIKETPEFKYLEEGRASKMIIAGDGDIIKNRVNRDRQQYYALEYDRYTKRTYGNKDFILNAINYLCDDSGLIEARSKVFKIRLLDVQKTMKEKMFWQLINTILPVIFIVFVGLVINFFRKRKFTYS
jgi:ABC-2 type transport system permease protein